MTALVAIDLEAGRFRRYYRPPGSPLLQMTEEITLDAETWRPIRMGDSQLDMQSLEEFRRGDGRQP